MFDHQVSNDLDTYEQGFRIILTKNVKDDVWQKNMNRSKSYELHIFLLFKTSFKWFIVNSSVFFSSLYCHSPVNG